MSTTTSRSAAGFSVSAFAASLDGPDADLITLCDRLHAVRSAELAELGPDPTVVSPAAKLIPGGFLG
jgi:hypothetical protein